MRVPKRYGIVEHRTHITKALNTDSRTKAETLAPQLRSRIIAELEARLRGDVSPSEQERHRSLMRLARQNGVAPKTASEIAAGEISELVNRLSLLEQLDKRGLTENVPAVLGGFDVPSTTISRVAAQMVELRSDMAKPKNDRQLRNWKSRYERAARIFGEVIEDKPVKSISDKDVEIFKMYWEERVRDDDVTKEYANKHFGYMRTMIDAFYFDLRVPNPPNPFGGAKLGPFAICVG